MTVPKIGGRPTKFDAKKAKRILELVRAGNYMSVAAEAVGVHSSTLDSWIKAGDKGDQRFEKFAQDMRAAFSVYETKAVETISAAAKKDPALALKMLQLRSPRRWAMRVKVELADTLEEFLDRVEKVVSPDVFERLLLAADAVDRAPKAGEAPAGEDPEGD